MRKWIASLVACIGLTLLVAAPALGAPSNGSKAEVIPVTCGGVALHVLVGAGGPAWGSDAAGNLNGSMYLVKEIDVRVYPGTLTTEPTATDPVFAFAKTFGNRTGLGAATQCTFVEFDATGPATAFGDVVVVQVR